MRSPGDEPRPALHVVSSKPLIAADDLLLRALRGLPPLEPDPAHDARVVARATAELRTGVARRAQLARRAARWARPLVPVPIAAFVVIYLLWAAEQAVLVFRRPG